MLFFCKNMSPPPKIQCLNIRFFVSYPILSKHGAKWRNGVGPYFRNFFNIWRIISSDEILRCIVRWYVKQFFFGKIIFQNKKIEKNNPTFFVKTFFLSMCRSTLSDKKKNQKVSVKNKKVMTLDRRSFLFTYHGI